jgi:hypothetical protein
LKLINKTLTFNFKKIGTPIPTFTCRQTAHNKAEKNKRTSASHLVEVKPQTYLDKKNFLKNPFKEIGCKIQVHVLETVRGI